MVRISWSVICLICMACLLLAIEPATAGEYKTGLGVDPSEGYAPLTTYFFDGGSYTIDLDGAYPVEWYWDLDDGTTSSEKSFYHTYTEPGTYYPEAEVLWSNGHYGTGTTHVVSVYYPVTEDITKPPTYYPDPYPGSYEPAGKNPDLTSSELWILPDAVKAGETLTITGRIINLGGRDVSTVDVGYYLSTNSYYDSSDIEIGGYSVNAPAGYETFDKQLIVIPENTASGSYYVIELIDPDNRVYETDENNNENYKLVEISGTKKEEIYQPKPVISAPVTLPVTPQITATPYIPPYTDTTTPTPYITQKITTPPTIPVTPRITTPVTPQITTTRAPVVTPQKIIGGYLISVSPKETSAYAGEDLDYTLTITADPSFQESISLNLVIDAVITTFSFDLGRVDPPYPKTIVRTVPIPAYLPGGVTISGHIVGESSGGEERTDVSLHILGSGVSLPESIILSGIAAILIAVGALVGISAAGLSSSLAGVQAAHAGTKPDSGSSEKGSTYTGRVTGVIWRKERNYVWIGLPDSAEPDDLSQGSYSKPPVRTCSCGAPLSESAEFCGSCGKPVAKEPPVQGRICPSCKSSVGSDAAFCGNCGMKF